MQKKLLIICLCLSIAVSSCGLVYGMVSVGVTNEFETGIVDIRLEEYQKNTDGEEPWEDNPLVLPGDKISKIPRIFNDGNDCYVRVKISFRGTDDINENNLLGISNEWIKADDGYLYYTQVIPHGKHVDIFEELQIPVDFPQENEETMFYIDIDADAIQSKNFEPNFESAQPWGDIEILECKKEGMYDISTFKQSDNQSFSITYQGDVKKLAKNADDFFANFPYLMPGDAYSDTLELENDSNKDIKLYFRSQATDETDLLDKIQLKITTKINGETKVFYEGSLRAAELNENSVLGMLPANATGKFDFEIYVPHELNNEYTITSSFVNWIFSTEEIVETETDNPKTGDDANLILWVSTACFAVSGLLLVVMFMTKNEKKKEGAGNEAYTQYEKL